MKLFSFDPIYKVVLKPTGLSHSSNKYEIKPFLHLGFIKEAVFLQLNFFTVINRLEF